MGKHEMYLCGACSAMKLDVAGGPIFYDIYVPIYDLRVSFGIVLYIQIKNIV